MEETRKSKTILEVRDLNVVYETDLETVYAVNGVSFTVKEGETLGLVNELGVENIEARILEISTYCMDELERIGGTLITHRDLDHRSGIVIARLYEDLETERQILKELHTRKIFIAQRFTDYVGGFRISCQYFNNREDIDRMIEAMEDLIAKTDRKPDYQKKW